jgi:hypothetical protein
MSNAADRRGYIYLTHLTYLTQVVSVTRKFGGYHIYFLVTNVISCYSCHESVAVVANAYAYNEALPPLSVTATPCQLPQKGSRE